MSDIFLGLRSSDTKTINDNCEDSSSTHTDSFIDSFIGMVGGSDNKIPNGGYPPIKKCEKKKEEKKKNTDTKKKEKKQEFFSNNSERNLSIHQILDNRRKKPFFEI